MLEKIKELFRSNENDNDLEYVSCRHLEGGITFMEHYFRTCCSNKTGVNFITDYKGEAVDWKKIHKQRKEVIENAKKGILPKNCIGCIDLEKKKWQGKGLINNIYINHWDHCNCACCYCVSLGHEQFLVKKPKPGRYYDVYPHLKEMYRQKMIAPDVHFELVGGDLTVLEETDKIINLFLDKGAGEAAFHSSCIDYSKGIERTLKELKNVSFDFSIDCGNRELYKKIKRIDAFDRVKENLKRYMAASDNSVKAMNAKYIIIDGLNDNIQALDEWIDFINELGIKQARLDVNFQRFFPEFHHPDPSVPAVYYEMFEHYNKRIKELGIEDRCWEFTRRVMEEGGIPKGYQQ